MIKRNRTEERDEVLFAFHVACEVPTPEFVEQWVRRYPQYEDDFRQHAGILAARLVHAPAPQPAPDETMLARGRSRALNAIYNADVEARMAQDAPDIGTFIQFVEAAGTTIAALARKIDIDRMVLGELAAGRMALPIGRRLTDALVAALRTIPQDLDAAIRQALASPRLGHAKADQAPSINVRSYEEIILESKLMTDEQKKYWLGQETTWTPGVISD
jgi:hypothetical protein